MLNNTQLEEFWAEYVGDSGKIESDATTQVFMRGPYAGYSIYDLMLYCAEKLGKTMPVMVNSYPEFGEGEGDPS